LEVPFWRRAKCIGRYLCHIAAFDVTDLGQTVVEGAAQDRQPAYNRLGSFANDPAGRVFPVHVRSTPKAEQ
jgi:hypothetical protein